MSQQEKGSTEIIPHPIIHCHCGDTTPSTCKDRSFASRGRCNCKLLSASRFDKPLPFSLVSCLTARACDLPMTALYPAIAAMSKCRNAKPTTPTASRSLPTPSKGCRRDAHRGPSIPAMPWFSGMMNTARRGTMPLPMTWFCQSPSSLIVLACDDLEGGPAREDGTKREKAFQCRSRC